MDGVERASTKCGIVWTSRSRDIPYPIRNINDKYHKKIPRCKECFATKKQRLKSRLKVLNKEKKEIEQALKQQP